jgi:uroporphyrinogen-III decarboxylase
MSDFFLDPPIDFARHNADVAQVMEAYRAGRPTRAPVQFSMNPRMILQNRQLNTWGYDWKTYFENPDVRWTVDLAFYKWMRFHVPQDAEMGYPKEWPGVYVHFQNGDEAAWFGCPLHYPAGDMPFIDPILKDDKRRLYDLAPPDPLSGGVMAMAMEHYQHLEAKRKTTDFEGIPVGPSGIFGAGTDGPFTVACNLRGASEVASDLYEDPQYVHDLLGFITDAVIARMRAVKDFLGQEYPTPGWFFADDSIELISTAMYREFVLPYHKKLLDVFSQGGPNGIHLCGRVQRHLPFLKEALNIQTFDLGYPTDLGRARRELGEEATLIGNIAPHLLALGPEEAIRNQVKKVCESGVLRGGRFILHEGNNSAPGTPARHFAAMYEAGKQYAVYSYDSHD